jgi:hypothetical protein
MVVVDTSESAATYTMEAILACGFIFAVIAVAPLVGPQASSPSVYDDQSLLDIARDSLTLLSNIPDSDISTPLSEVLSNATMFSRHSWQVEFCLSKLLNPEIGFRLTSQWGTIGSNVSRPGAMVHWIFLDTDASIPREAVLEVWYA